MQNLKTQTRPTKQLNQSFKPEMTESVGFQWRTRLKWSETISLFAHNLDWATFIKQKQKKVSKSKVWWTKASLWVLQIASATGFWCTLSVLLFRPQGFGSQTPFFHLPQYLTDKTNKILFEYRNWKALIPTFSYISRHRSKRVNLLVEFFWLLAYLQHHPIKCIAY